MPKKKQFKFHHPSTSTSRGSTITSSSSSTTTRDSSRQTISDSSTEGGVTAHLQSLRELARPRPDRQAINDFIQSSTAPSLPPEITQSLNAHNGRGNNSNNSRFYGTRALRTWENGQEITFHNMARPGQEPVWTRATPSNPSEAIQNKSSKFIKGFTKLALSTTGTNALPEEGSLSDTCLRTLARNWAFHRQYDSLNLDRLPLYLKIKLVAYVGIYGGEIGNEEGKEDQELGKMDMSGLKMLFSTETDVQEVRMLDFTGCIHENFTVKAISDWLLNKGHLQNTTIDDSKLTATVDKANLQDLTWEQQLAISSNRKTSSVSPYTQIPTSLTVAPFENLSHLSLAYPATSKVWRQLYSFTRRKPSVLRRITHLSLAHWPSPYDSVGGQANAVRHVLSDPTVRFDGDTQIVSEWWPCQELSALANATPRLKELDLEGCAEWALLLVQWNAGLEVDEDDTFQGSKLLTPFVLRRWDELEVIHMGQNCYPKRMSQANQLTGGLFEVASFYRTVKPHVLVNSRAVRQKQVIDSESESENWWLLEQKIWNASKELIKGDAGIKRKGIVLNGSYPKTLSA